MTQKCNFWKAGGHDRVFVSMVAAPLLLIEKLEVMKLLRNYDVTTL